MLVLHTKFSHQTMSHHSNELIVSPEFTPSVPQWLTFNLFWGLLFLLKKTKPKKVNLFLVRKLRVAPDGLTTSSSGSEFIVTTNCFTAGRCSVQVCNGLTVGGGSFPFCGMFFNLKAIFETFPMLRFFVVSLARRGFRSHWAFCNQITQSAPRTKSRKFEANHRQWWLPQ